MSDDIHQQLREKYSDLIERHRELKASAREADITEDPLHSPGEIRAEADGVILGVRAIEDVLNAIERDGDE